nr:RecName: Full=Myotoxin TmC4-47.2 [Thalassophryne maculosa]
KASSSAPKGWTHHGSRFTFHRGSM